MTPNRKNAGFSVPIARASDTYVVCLDCGKEFTYDWESMRIGQPMSLPVTAVEVQSMFW